MGDRSSRVLAWETIITKASVEKRVLFLAPYLGDGGINVHMLTLGSELRRLGWEVAICSGGPLADRQTVDRETSATRSRRAPVPGDYEDAGITHFDTAFPTRVHRLRDLPRLLLVPASIWQVLRAVRRYRPSLLHSHSRQMGIYGLAVQRLMGVPFVSSVHNPIPTTNRLWASTIGARAVAVSDEIMAILARDYGVDPGRMRVVAPGADAEHFRPPSPEERGLARQHYGIRSGQFVLAFVGSLTTNKRPDTLIAAVSVLLDSGHDVAALIAGDGPVEESLRQQVTRQAIGTRVQLLGYQDTRSVLWAADALVLPSRSEGSPLVVAEAMLSGVVVVSTPAGAAQRLIRDVTGLTFTYGDQEGLARQVAELIDHPDLRDGLAARALDDARSRFSSAGMGRAIEEVYLAVLQEQGR